MASAFIVNYYSQSELFQKADDMTQHNLGLSWAEWWPLTIQYMQSMNIYCPIMLPLCSSPYASQVLLFTGDRRMPRWQYFFFFVWGRLFVISHLMLTCKLLRARVTIADDSFVLSPLRLRLLMLWFSWNPLWLWHKWDRERKHRLENTPKAPALEPVVSLEAVGDFGQNNSYCSASSKCVEVQAQILFLHSYVSMLRQKDCKGLLISSKVSKSALLKVYMCPWAITKVSWSSHCCFVWSEVSNFCRECWKERKKERGCTYAPVWRDLWVDQTKECKNVYSERVWEERFTIRRLGHNSKFTLTYITFWIT